jgi:hypothetical protein
MVIEIEFPNLSYISILGMNRATCQLIYSTFHNVSFCIASSLFHLRDDEQPPA